MLGQKSTKKRKLTAFTYIKKKASVMTEFSQRRARLIAQIGQNAIAIIPTNTEKVRNNDCEFPFRADSSFYYLTGFTEPNACLVLLGDGTSILFCQPKDELREIWNGYRLGPAAAIDRLGVTQAYSIEELDEKISELLVDTQAIWYPFGLHAGLETKVDGWIKTLRTKVRAGGRWPTQLRDVCALLNEMRLIKSEQEIAILRRAGEISARAHVRTMQACARMVRSGKDVREYHLDAELLHEFRRNGSQFPAYSSIVAAGANACVLHYLADAAPIVSGDLVLIDAGCELDCYASDITRTFPANARYSGPQRAVYDVVLAAQEAALAQIQPGKLFCDPHEAAVRVLCQGMLDLGLLSKNTHGTLDDVISSKAYFQFYMHRTGHWMGMDVHDCGHYKDDNTKSSEPRLTRTLQAGMVLTVEPGLYIRPAAGVPESFHNIGIRIEDDAIVTPSGYELTTRGAPVDATEIEALMAD
jgi:Xaa-Pro aminopeptidase